MRKDNYFSFYSRNQKKVIYLTIEHKHTKRSTVNIELQIFTCWNDFGFVPSNYIVLS